MLDPLSIVTGSAALIGSCAKISKFMIAFVEDNESIDQVAGSFRKQIETLSSVLESIRSHFSADEVASILSHPGHESTHWENVIVVLRDCHSTVRPMEKLIEGVIKTDKQGVRARTGRQMRMYFTENELEFRRKEIESYTATLNLSFHMISISSAVACRSWNEGTSKRLDELAADIRGIIRMLNALSEANLPGGTPSGEVGSLHSDVAPQERVSNLKECVRSAGVLLESASTVISGASGGGTVDRVIVHSIFGSEMGVGDFLSPERRRKLEDWIPSASVLAEEDTRTAADGQSEITFEPSSQPSQSQSLAQSERNTEKGGEDDEDDTFVEDESEEDSDDIDLSLGVVKDLVKAGKKKYDAADYGATEKYLEEAWQELTIMKREDTADSRVANELSREILECLVRVYLKQKLFGDAERVLVDLRSLADSTEAQNSAVGHTLSEVLFYKGDLDKARTECEMVVKARQRSLGKKHPAFHKSVDLMAAILDTQGRGTVASAYRKHLPKGYRTSYQLPAMTAAIPQPPISSPKATPAAAFGRSIASTSPPAEMYAAAAAHGPSSPSLSSSSTLDGLNPVFTDLSLASDWGSSMTSLPSSPFARRNGSSGSYNSASPFKSQPPTMPPPGVHPPARPPRQREVPSLPPQPHVPPPPPPPPPPRSRAAATHTNSSNVEASPPSPEVLSFIRKCEEIQSLTELGRKDDAAGLGVAYVKSITEKHMPLTYIPKWDEVKENIEKSGKGLCGTGHGDSTLHMLARCGLAGFVSVLLEKGADIEARDKFNATPLHISSGHGHVDVVVLLLRKGAEVDARDEKLATPLHLAVHKKQFNVVHVLLRTGNPEVDPDVGLMKRSDINAQTRTGETPLHQAAQIDDPAMIECLLSYGANIEAKNEDETTPLMYSAMYGHLSSVELLISRNANFTTCSKALGSPLHFAALFGQLNIVAFLLSKGADIEIRGKEFNTPIHLAAISDEAETIQLLASKGADVNAREVDNWTPLHLAASKGNAKCVVVLVKLDCDMNAKAKCGRTAAQISRVAGHKEIAKALDPRRKGKTGWWS